MFNKSPGVYGFETMNDAVASPQLGFTGAAVITSLKGPTTPTLILSVRQFNRLYGKPTMDNPSMHCVSRFLEKGNVATIRRVVADGDIAASGTIAGAIDPYLTITAENEGSWGNDVVVTFNENADLNDVWDLSVSYKGDVVETFTVSFDPEDTDGFGQPRYIEDRVNGRSDYIVVDHDITETPATAIADGDTVELSSGADDATGVISSDLLDPIAEFGNVEEIEANYFINAGWTDSAVQAAIVAVMESRMDGVAVLDTPNDTDASALVTFRKTTSNINSSYAGFYAGWLKITEKETGKTVEIPPSGDVAAVMSRTQQIAAWEVPAGLRRGVIQDVIGVNKIWSEAERDLLYPAGINPIQSMPGQGVVVWGQKTLYGIPSSWTRFNVRFVLNYVRTTAVASLKPFVFQANTNFTRESIFSLLDGFMAGVKANDGVFNYRINIGTDLNTDQVIQNNQLLVDIEIQPNYAAEFIKVDTITVPLSQDLS